MNPRRSTPPNSQPSIEVHIEELVLHGLPLTSSQGREIQAAVETELAHLLTVQGLDRFNAGDTSRLSTVAIQLTNGDKPAQLGRQIARSIYAALTPTSASPQQNRSFERASE